MKEITSIIKYAGINNLISFLCCGIECLMIMVIYRGCQMQGILFNKEWYFVFSISMVLSLLCLKEMIKQIAKYNEPGINFLIFRWWEKWGKPLIFTVILGATAFVLYMGLILNEASGFSLFCISTAYALFLFLAIIPIGFIDKYVNGKILERKDCLQSLNRLRAGMINVETLSVEDIEEMRSAIIFFQIFTGRSAEQIKKIQAGEKIPFYVKEKGFIYTKKLEKMENSFLAAYDARDFIEIKRTGAELLECYKKIAKDLEKNYKRILSVYGVDIVSLLEKDDMDNDIMNSFNQIYSEVKNIQNDVDDLHNELSNINMSKEEIYSKVQELYDSVNEKLDDISFDLSEIALRDDYSSTEKIIDSIIGNIKQEKNKHLIS